MNEQALSKLIYKIKSCIYFDTLLSLEDDYNAIGLTLQTSAGSRAILCKIVDGKPYTKEVIDDYIFLCPLKDRDREISEPARQRIIDFIMNAAGEPNIITNAPRKWQEGSKTYGQVILVNEDINLISQFISD